MLIEEVGDDAAGLLAAALGYAPEKAAWKARRQGQYTHNEIVTAGGALGVPMPHSA
ncbi:hypothetical protein ACFV9D_27120 [Streptomyces sp. NPDC059875]|uniref:hypothetical protein n=1 Tax=unclassified Streptomyces TaxID=2593676 RepID=UPI00364A63AA